MLWRARPARCEDPARQLERPAESAGRRRGDPSARAVRPDRGVGTRRRPRDEWMGGGRGGGRGVERGEGGGGGGGGADAEPHATVDGMRVTRVGGRHSFALRGRGAVRRALREKAYDIVVEDVNKLPLFLPALTALPFVAIVPHLFGTTAFAEASWPVAATVWASELPIPWVYRRAGFHAISESTRDDLVRRGVVADRVIVIHPG